MIDGVRNLDTFGGNAFVAPNLFAVSEFRVENNSYSAATGHSAGAQVNLISRNGTNQFHGNVFEFFRNDALNAPFAAPAAGKPGLLPENRYNDFGYDVGGPLVKNKLFFFWWKSGAALFRTVACAPAPCQPTRNALATSAPYPKR